MRKKLQKAIDLARKTGDRLIVFDNTGAADPYIVMSMEEYERLAVKRSDVRGLTEDELLDKINRDIAVWKSEQEFFNEYLDNGRCEMEKDENLANAAKENEPVFANNEEDEEEEFYFEPEQPKPSFYPSPVNEDFNPSGLAEEEEESQDDNPGSVRKWTIPANRKKAADEVIDEGRGDLMEDVGELPY